MSIVFYFESPNKYMLDNPVNYSDQGIWDEHPLTVTRGPSPLGCDWADITSSLITAQVDLQFKRDGLHGQVLMLSWPDFQSVFVYSVGSSLSYTTSSHVVSWAVPKSRILTDIRTE